MEYGKLLNLGAEMGYRLMLSGAEIYRTEDSVRRLLTAYGLADADVFAIPSCLIVSQCGEEGEPITRVRYVPTHGTDLELLEEYNAVCRDLCRERPDCEQAMARLKAVEHRARSFSMGAQLVGYFMIAAFFCLFFRGSLTDAFLSGLCGVVGGVCAMSLSGAGTNNFFRTLTASAVSALPALTLGALMQGHQDTIIAGAYMALLPGLAFTTAMRDIMAGDMLSGLTKAAEGILIAVAIVLGTGAAIGLVRMLPGG